MTDQRSEALEKFQDVLSCLLSPPSDIKTLLRKTYLACQLMGWKKESDWLYKELNGYLSEDEIPFYRILSGVYEWSAIDTQEDSLIWEVDKKYHPEGLVQKENPPIIKIHSNLDWIIETSPNGYLNSTKELKKVYVSYKKRDINLTKLERYDAYLFSRILKSLDSKLFDFVSNAVILLKYGNLIKTFFEKYQLEADKKLIELGFEDRLREINQMLQTDNPEAWRDSGLSCRTLLHDLALYLWKDTRDYYDPLPGSNKTERLKVTEDMFVNRLEAYMHQKKGFHKKMQEYLGSEIKYLSELIRKLYNLQSTAKSKLSLPEVISIVLATYFVIGELVQKTDMIPIEKY